MISRIMFIVIFVMLMVPFVNCQAQREYDLKELNNQIRRENRFAGKSLTSICPQL